MMLFQNENILIDIYSGGGKMLKILTTMIEMHALINVYTFFSVITEIIYSNIDILFNIHISLVVRASVRRDWRIQDLNPCRFKI